MIAARCSYRTKPIARRASPVTAASCIPSSSHVIAEVSKIETSVASPSSREKSRPSTRRHLETSSADHVIRDPDGKDAHNSEVSPGLCAGVP